MKDRSQFSHLFCEFFNPKVKPSVVEAPVVLAAAPLIKVESFNYLDPILAEMLASIAAPFAKKVRRS